MEAHRAANAARYAIDLRRAHLRWDRQPAVSRHFAYRYGLHVTLVQSKKRFVNSSSRRAIYTHIARHVFIVWRTGEPVLMDVRFLCGGNTTSPLLSDTPAMQVCPKCRIVEIGYEQASELISKDNSERPEDTSSSG